MQCPVDHTELLMTERSGIEIDYCPKCRGIWLDRGELDKLIERAAQADTPRPVLRSTPPNTAYTDYDDDDYKRKNDYDYDRDDDRHPNGRKRKSFLGEIFDIFD